MTRPDTLLHRILGINLLLFVAVLFAASALATLDVQVEGERRDFLLLAMAMIVVLLENFLLLRRRFDPLERLIAEVEAIDPAHPTGLAAAGGSEEIERLAASFPRPIDPIEAERD